MGVETSMLDTWRALRKLFDQIDELVHIISEDAPYPHSFADAYGGAAASLLGWLSDALDAVLDAHNAARVGDQRKAVQALELCSENFLSAVRVYYGDLAAPHALEDLKSLAREHPEDWSGWASSIQVTLDQCDPLGVQQALNRSLIDVAALDVFSNFRFTQESQPASPDR
jgi:hypothetical protein